MAATKSFYGILLPHTITKEYGYHDFYLYDVFTGAFKYKIRLDSSQNHKELKHLCGNEPRHVAIKGDIEYDRIHTDGHYAVIVALEYAVLPSRVFLPDSLVDEVAPHIAPLKFKPSPMSGYQVIADDL